MMPPPQGPLEAKRRDLFTELTALPIYLDPEDERECLEEAVEQLIDEWWEDLDAAFPDGETGLTNPLPAPERFENYVRLTEESDLEWLLLPDYQPLFEAGLAPAPASYFWAALLRELPRDAKRELGEFRRLWQRYGGRD